MTQKHFLEQVGVVFAEGWTFSDTECAYRAWNTCVQARRTRDTPKRPLADMLIGYSACRYQGLITRNPSDFCRWFPRLKLRQPQTACGERRGSDLESEFFLFRARQPPTSRRKV
jgi:hypothetical protein